MALIIIKDRRELAEEMREAQKKYHVFRMRCYSNHEQVQYEFCTALEKEKRVEMPSLFENPKVKAYLAEFGVTYVGNYLLECADWGLGMPADEVTQQFVTFLNPTLQLGCLALFYDESDILIASCMCDVKHLAPVVKQRDVYLELPDFQDMYPYDEFVEQGVEVRVAGRSSLEMSRKEFMSFLFELEESEEYLSRELDARVFPADFKEKNIFEPTEMSLAEYLQDDDIFESWAEENPEIRTARIRINGVNSYNGFYRRYPIHYLFKIDGAWKYISNNSVKNPRLSELLWDALGCTETFDYDSQCHIDVSAATEIFVLVLDCDEICDATRYWEQVAFVAKYDKAENVMEICDKNRGILEFHNLLQESENLVQTQGER